MKILALLAVCCMVASAFGGDWENMKREIKKRSECDVLADGYHCVGSRLFHCYNNDVVWSWNCVTGNCLNATDARCEYDETDNYCEDKWSTNSRAGAYCRDETTRTSCRFNGDVDDYDCATNAEPEGTCEESTFWNWAYCEYPPKCDSWPTTLPSGTNMTFCVGAYSPDTRDDPDYDNDVPAPVVESAETITAQDKIAFDLYQDLTAISDWQSAIEECDYLIHSTACWIAFPDCPSHQDCVRVCEEMNGCIQEKVNGSVPLSYDCEENCGTFAAASSQSSFLLEVISLLF